jgi:hypothetical protein
VSGVVFSALMLSFHLAVLTYAEPMIILFGLKAQTNNSAAKAEEYVPKDAASEWTFQRCVG